MMSISLSISTLEQLDPQDAEFLLPMLYDELRRLAARRLSQEDSGQTLQATALVHEAYLRLTCGDSRRSWINRGSFLAAVAETMRRIIVDNARSKARQKRGGARRRVALTDQLMPEHDEASLALDDALKLLAIEDPLARSVVELRRFGG